MNDQVVYGNWAWDCPQCRKRFLCPSTSHRSLTTPAKSHVVLIILGRRRLTVAGKRTKLPAVI